MVKYEKEREIYIQGKITYEDLYHKNSSRITYLFQKFESISMVHFDVISILNISPSIFSLILVFFLFAQMDLCAHIYYKREKFSENIEAEIFKIEITSKCTIAIGSNFQNK